MPSIIQNFMLYYSRSSRYGNRRFFVNRNLHNNVEKTSTSMSQNTKLNPQNENIQKKQIQQLKRPKKKLQNTDLPASNNDARHRPKTCNSIIKSIQIMKKQKEALLTGVDPSKETLAREKDKFPAKKEPPL
jgi:hypothetical protein